MKKTVNVLIVEPKNLLMDLTKKAIQAKPDDKYDIVIVGTATTAKGGYFELYKHRPHILFLNPELEDEDGLSFIKHALERMPYLKIVVMASRLVDKQAYLDGGAHAVAHVPIQRATLWRTTDRLIEEIDSIGLLDVSEYIPYEDESPSLPEEDLFEIELDERPEYTPIFEDIRNDPVKESTDENESVATEEQVDEEDDTIILGDEPTPIHSQANDDFLIIEDEEPAIIGLPAKNEQTSEEAGADDELLIFDPFVLSSSTQEEAEGLTEDKVNGKERLSTSQPLPDDEPNAIGEQKEDNVEDNPNDNQFHIFKFETEESGNDENTHGNETVLTPETEQQEEDLNDEPTINLFTFERDEEPKIETSIVEEKEDESIFSPPPITRFSLEDEELAEEPPIPLFHVEERETQSNENSVVETTMVANKDSSNNTRTEIPLYSEATEYNKSTLKESRSFDLGFYNRNGHFVPLYPPREMFKISVPNAVTNVDVQPTRNKPFMDPQEPTSKEGVFSSVKKLFRRL